MALKATFRDFTNIHTRKYNAECCTTLTAREQMNTEYAIEKKFNLYKDLHIKDADTVYICRSKHEQFLQRHFLKLSPGFVCLDSSRPWLVYWSLNAAKILNYNFSNHILELTIDFLIKCRNPDGGFGGGPGQYSHLATTYGAVNSLCIIGTPRAYEAIDRETLKQFLWSVRESDGAFRLHVGGENDIRGAYCAISCAKLCNFTKTEEESLFRGTGDWIANCQTYEGGFGGAPDLEAHGGYTFCGLAGLGMLGCTDKCNTHDVLKWAVFRQMNYEGGFQGRTNKLVDGCYTFWVGAVIPIAQAIIAKQEPKLAKLLKGCLFDRSALQEFILLCCQSSQGGLVDKPGKPADPYHTCYTLSGMAIAQHAVLNSPPFVLGNLNNEVQPTHPLHNIPPLAVLQAYNYFSYSDSSMEEDEQSDDNNEFFNRSTSKDTATTTTTDNENLRESSTETTTTTSEYEDEMSSS